MVYFNQKLPIEPKLKLSYKISPKRSSKLNSTRLIVMLITINISFCVLSMPMSILQIVYYSYANDFAIDPTKTLGEKQTYDDKNSEALLELIDLFHSIAELLQFLNHGSNFIFYSLSGKTFRNVTKRFFCNKFNLIKNIMLCRMRILFRNIK